MPPKTKGKRKPKKQPTQKQKQKQSQKVVVNIQTTAGRPSRTRGPTARREMPPQPPQPPQPQMFLSSQPTAQQIAYEFSRINMDRPRTIAEPVPQPQFIISPTFENRPQTQISPDISPVIRPQTQISPDISPVIQPQISPVIDVSPFIQPQTNISPTIQPQTQINPETSIRTEINPSFNVEPNISNTTQPPNISNTYIGTSERHRPMERQPARTIDELMEPDRFEPMRRPRPEQDDTEEVIDFTIPEAQAIRFDEINPMIEQQREQARGEIDEFTNMTVPQLRQELASRNQSTSGNKAELLRRIREGTPKGRRGRPRNP